MSGFSEREAARNNFRNAMAQQAVDRAERLQAANSDLIKELNDLRGKMAEMTVERDELRKVLRSASEPAVEITNG